MRKVILLSVIQQLLYHISSVESMIGQNIIPIRVGELPFIASFQILPADLDFCRGALIAEKHVITLSSCLEGLSRERFRIVFEVADGQEPAVAYTAASWTTYVDWAIRQGIPYNNIPVNVAIVELTDRVNHVNPVPLSGLTKRQLDGTTAIMVGRSNVLSKTSVQLLSDEDCERSMRMLLHHNPTFVFDDRYLRTSADPFALLEAEDLGSPLIHARDKSLVGLGFGFSPREESVRGNFSIEFIRQHQVNLYVGIHYYRLFIHSIIPAAPGA